MARQHPLEVFIVRGQARFSGPRYAACGPGFATIAFWNASGSSGSVSRTALGVLTCSGRAHVARAAEGRLHWHVWEPQTDWTPPAWQHPPASFACEPVLEWAAGSRIDDPEAEAHQAARAAIVLALTRSWAHALSRARCDVAAALHRVHSAAADVCRRHHAELVIRGVGLWLVDPNQSSRRIDHEPTPQERQRAYDAALERARWRTDTR